MHYSLAESSWGKEEIEAIHRVIDTDRFTMGEHVKQFETAYAEKFGAKYAVMTSSGSTANLVGLASFFFKKNNPLKPGDEVIVPSISWATTYYPLQQYGLKLNFLDVELDTLNMDVSKLEEALTPNTRMVVAVSILGNPCALTAIRKFCDQHGLYLFEDNCESMGAELDGKLCGTFGDIGTFSTFFSHHISTMEGGIILTDNEEMFHLAKSLRAHGWTRDLPHDSSIYDRGDNDFFEAYRFILPGYNARPLELSGAIGLEQLKKLDSMIATRRKNAEVFVNLFSDDDRFIIQKENGKSSWFSFTIILNPECSTDRSTVMEAMRKADIEFRIITGGCFLRHDVIKYFDYETVSEIVNANIAHDRGFFVGNFPRDIRPQIEGLRKVLDNATSS
jgi:CDP-6-deoxy-D-xylo-4-hexulose-3-dehydrase